MQLKIQANRTKCIIYVFAENKQNPEVIGPLNHKFDQVHKAQNPSFTDHPLHSFPLSLSIFLSTNQELTQTKTVKGNLET